MNGISSFARSGQKSIAHPELLIVLRRVENRGALEVAHRLCQTSGQVFRYTITSGRAERDVSRDLRGAIPPVKKRHFASIADPSAIAGLMRAIKDYNGHLVTRCALQLAPLTFVRAGELRKAEWSEFNFEVAEWRISAQKMKCRPPISYRCLYKLSLFCMRYKH